jgi:hypothetical protein
MIGMGSVVTRSVPDFQLVIGNPARSIGCVCRCGQPLVKWDELNGEESIQLQCRECGWEFELRGREVVERVTMDREQVCARL